MPHPVHFSCVEVLWLRVNDVDLCNNGPTVWILGIIYRNQVQAVMRVRSPRKYKGSTAEEDFAVVLIAMGCFFLVIRARVTCVLLDEGLKKWVYYSTRYFCGVVMARSKRAA